MRRFVTVAILALTLVALGCKGDTPAATPDEPPESATEVATAAVEPTSTPVPAPTATPTPEPPSIEVIGSEDFKAWTEQALGLLKADAPDAYADVLASIDVIESVEAGSGMYVEERRYAVGELTAYAPGYTTEQQLIWYAGTIVHDGCHSARFMQGEPHTGKDAEIACLEVQKGALALLTNDPLFPNYVQGLIDGADDPNNQYWNQPDRHW